MTRQPDVSHGIVDQFASWVSTRSGKLWLIGISTGLLLLSLLGLLLIGRAALKTISRKVDLKTAPPNTLGEFTKQYPAWKEILSDPKLESTYREFLGVYQQGGEQAAMSLAKQRGLLNQQGELILTLELSTDDSSALIKKLNDLGVHVTAANGRSLDIAIPWERVRAIAENPHPTAWLEDPSGKPLPELELIVRVRLVSMGEQDSLLSAGDIESEGVSVIGADQWQQAGIDGTGVKVGLIDTGYGGYTNLLGTELPEQVTTKSFEDGMTDVGDTDVVHGAACAEVIHDVAPGAELFLAAANSQTETMEAAQWLEEQGVKVISMSKTWFAGSMDGTSDLDKFIEQSAERGVAWVIAGGNFAEGHYLGDFTDTDGDGYHEFPDGSETLRIYPEESVSLALNWDDWQVGDQDYDLYLLDGDLNVIASSENRQNGPDSGAYELINYSGLDPDGVYYVAFYAHHATHPAKLNFFLLHGQVDGSMPEASISMPAEDKLVLGIGATNWQTDELEPYSGQGPTLDGRLKPDLDAPSVVSIASSENAFNGTSAAAPHAAGAAALVLQAYPDFTPQQVFEFLESRAVDLGDAGPDPQYGYGRLWLGDPNERFVPKAAEPTAPAELTPEPTSTLQATARPVVKSPVASKRAGIPWLGLLCLAVPGVFGLTGFVALGAVLVLRPKKPEMRYCPHCSQELRPSSRFCPRCGKPVEPHS